MVNTQPEASVGSITVEMMKGRDMLFKRRQQVFRIAGSRAVSRPLPRYHTLPTRSALRERTKIRDVKMKYTDMWDGNI